jgi:hypothetical protein
MDLADRIGRRIKLRDLHILLAVAEKGIVPAFCFTSRRFQNHLRARANFGRSVVGS